jgi:predicted nucleotidyltransferase
MKEQLNQLINERSPGSKPIFLVIRGSHAYGTNIETSDTDYAGVFIQSLDDILGSKYKQQVNDDTNDTVIYELRRFLELLASNNPTVLELLNTPEDCIIYKDPIFDLILENREQFITKICANSFGGYARQQIGKAKGQNKKQNWEKDKVTRKDLLDFCYVIRDEKTIPWKKWNDMAGGYEEKFIGAVNVSNAKDVYTLYYDGEACNCFGEFGPQEDRDRRILELKAEGKPLGFGYKGLVNTGHEDENGNINYGISNQLRLSSIPKGQTPICTIIYNKDGYSEHCKDYKEYQEWLEKRNLQRWVDVTSHGQQIDGKNMMHCRRLMDMAREIAEGKGILVKRDNAQELLAIRRGEIDLQTLIDHVESEIKEVDTLFKESNLPEKVDENFINSLLVKIRKSVYGIQ